MHFKMTPNSDNKFPSKNSSKQSSISTDSSEEFQPQSQPLQVTQIFLT